MDNQSLREKTTMTKYQKWASRYGWPKEPSIGPLTTFELEKELGDVFNWGAWRLYRYDAFEDLEIGEDDFSMFMFPVKFQGTNQEIYTEVRKRAIVLFRLILDKRLTGYYFTPRTLLDKWKHLVQVESKVTHEEFMKQPWVVKALAERDQRQLDEYNEDRNASRELARCLRRYQEVVV